jgi:hypothetical protein
MNPSTRKMLTMNKSTIISDQYDNWSDIFTEAIAPISPEPTQKPPAPTTALVCAPPRLAHRTLQTLRQTRMQMCSGTRPRPQVLPLHQPAGSNAGYGLCSTGSSRHGRSMPRELSRRTRDPRSNLQHQSRTASSQGASIEKRRVHRKPHNLGCAPDRSPPGGYSRRQHAGAFAPPKPFTKFAQRNQR